MRLQVTLILTYFDRSIIKKKWKFNRTPLGRAGAFAMRVARKSIRRRKNRNKHSPIGTPPFSHKEGAHPPFKLIFFEPDFLNTRVFVGMVGFGGKGRPVPGLQEHGGAAQRKVYRQVGRRTLKRRFTQPRQGGIITRKVTEGVRYPKRSFMLPALMVTLPRLPQFWANSFR